MILELASFLGTSVGGKLFGMISDSIAEKRHQEQEERAFNHQIAMAASNNLKEHYDSLGKQNSKGGYSPIAWAVTFIVVLFAVTYCYATLSCFISNPEQIVYTKDPSEDANTVSILFGTISFDISNNKILGMSRAGLGYLMCYPIIFILSMVTTGDKPRRK